MAHDHPPSRPDAATASGPASSFAMPAWARVVAAATAAGMLWLAVAWALAWI